MLATAAAGVPPSKPDGRAGPWQPSRAHTSGMGSFCARGLESGAPVQFGLSLGVRPPGLGLAFEARTGSTTTCTMAGRG